MSGAGLALAYAGVRERDTVVERVLANGVLAVLLFPYVSPVPVGSDVQPFGFAVAALALGLLLILRGYLQQLDLTDLLLLGGGYLYAFYADWRVQELDALFLRKNVVMLIAFPAYLAAKQLYPSMSRRTVLVVAWAYLGITLLQAVAPGVYDAFASRLLARVVQRSSARGLTGPCPEPSFLAYVAIGLPIVYRVVAANGRDPSPERERTEFRTLLGISVALILLARSVTGTLLGVALLGVVWLVYLRGWGRRLLLMAGAVLAVVVAGASAQLVLGERVATIVRLLATNPALVLMDGSIASRYVQIVGGAYTAATSPLGTGRSVGDPEVFDRASEALGFRRYIPRRSMRYILDNRTADGNIAVLSPVGDSLARMGLLFLVLLALLLAILRCPAASTASRVFLAFGIVSSFPLSFTPFWLLFGIHAGWTLHPPPSGGPLSHPVRPQS